MRFIGVAMRRHNRNRPFGAHDYEIVFPPLGLSRDAHILAKDAQPPTVGDLYTLDRSGCLFDLVVEEISGEVGGGWNARCKVAHLQWI